MFLALMIAYQRGIKAVLSNVKKATELVPYGIPYPKPSQVTAVFRFFATTFCIMLLSLSYGGDNHLFFQNSKHGVLIVDIV